MIDPKLKGRITRNANRFSRNLELMASFAENNVEQIIRKSVIDLFGKLVERTPVDTGHARANWNIDTKFDPSLVTRVVASDVRKSRKAGAAGKSNEVKSITAQKAREFEYNIVDQVIVIYNNVPYIEALENGHSKQAAQGFIAMTVKEFSDQFSANARQLAGEI